MVYRDCVKQVNRSSSHFADRSEPEPQAEWPQASRPHLPEPQFTRSEVRAAPDQTSGSMSQKGEQGTGPAWSVQQGPSYTCSQPAHISLRGVSRLGGVAPLPASIRAWLCVWPTDNPSFSLAGKPLSARPQKHWPVASALSVFAAISKRPPLGHSGQMQSPPLAPAPWGMLIKAPSLEERAAAEKRNGASRTHMDMCIGCSLHKGTAQWASGTTIQPVLHVPDDGP